MEGGDDREGLVLDHPGEEPRCRKNDYRHNHKDQFRTLHPPFFDFHCGLP